MEILTLPFAGLGVTFAMLPWLVGAAWTLFWIWMLVDVVRRDDSEVPGAYEYRRAAWAVAIAIVNVVALAYLFVVYLPARSNAQARATMVAGQPAAQAPPQA